MQWYKRSLFRNLVDMHIPSGDGNLEHFDAEEYGRCMETAGVDAVYVAASNCLGLCLYPTKVGYRHSVSEKRDLLEERISALRKRGISVVAYMNSWSTEAAKQHPQWQIRSSDGKAQGETSRFGTCCLNSPYRDLIRGMVEEVVSSYDIDGLWLDMVGFFASDCTCRWCRENTESKPAMNCRRPSAGRILTLSAMCTSKRKPSKSMPPCWQKQPGRSNPTSRFRCSVRPGTER